MLANIAMICKTQRHVETEKSGGGGCGVGRGEGMEGSGRDGRTNGNTAERKQSSCEVRNKSCTGTKGTSWGLQ